jgi:membrane protein YdbS with pleckstrin-like domain
MTHNKMVPGFVQLGILAVLFQVIIIAGFYSYLSWRYPIPDAELSPRTKSLLPERAERVLPERHETVTFCMIWRSVSAAAAA